MLQNLVTCNPVAKVAGGVPQYDSNHCITGYSISHKPASGSKTGGSSSFGGLLNGGSSSSWGSSSFSGSSSVTETSTFSSFNWESSNQQYVSNTGAFYVDQNGTTYQIIMDSQDRGFYKNSFGQELKISPVQNSHSVYYVDQNNMRHSLNVDTYGRLSHTSEQTGQLEDVKLSSQGHSYFDNSQGQRTYLIASDNTQSQNHGSQGNQGGFQNMFGSQSREGKLYYIDQNQDTHQLFIDQEGGYYLDSSDNIHQISTMGSAYYINSQGQQVKLLIDNALDVGVRESSGVRLVEENREGEGFYKSQWGQDTMLVQSSSTDFTDMMGRTQFQQSQRGQGQQTGGQGGFSNQFGSSQVKIEVGRMYYVMNGQTYELFVNENGVFYKNNGQMEQISSQGQAYYVDYQNNKELIHLTQSKAQVSINGGIYDVHQNTQGYPFITNTSGTSIFLGANKMAGFKQIAFVENNQSQSQGQGQGQQQSNVNLQEGHLYVEDQNGQTHQLLIHKGNSSTEAYYMDSNNQIQIVDSNDKAFYIDQYNQKQSLTIHAQNVWKQTGSGYKSVLENSQGDAYYTNSHGVGYELANGAEIQQSSSSQFGGFGSGSNSGSLFGKLGGGNGGAPGGGNGGDPVPKQPANCSPVAKVAGGTPVKDSRGCITSYTVGLVLMI